MVKSENSRRTEPRVSGRKLHVLVVWTQKPLVTAQKSTDCEVNPKTLKLTLTKISEMSENPSFPL